MLNQKTKRMKTAISLPDSVFQEAEDLAKRLGISRSELYVKALTHYLRSCNEKRITEKLNEIYAVEDSSLDPVMAKIQALSVPKEDW